MTCLYVALELRNGEPAWVAVRAACHPTDAEHCNNCRQALDHSGPSQVVLNHKTPRRPAETRGGCH